MTNAKKWRLELLSNEDVRRIHSVSLEILDSVGMRIPHKKILDLLADAGVKVDFKNETVRFPADIVEKQIEKSGKSYTLYGRDLDKRAQFGREEINFLSSSGQSFFIEEPQELRRKPNLEDLRKAAVLGDALGEIDIVGPMVVPLNLPSNTRDIRSLAELLKLTTKPISVWISGGENCRFILEILSIVRGGRDRLRTHPMLEILVQPISPLRWDKRSLEILLEVASWGLPVGIGSMAQASLTAPATLAGTIAQENAEILAGIFIAQSISPGLPVTYWGIPHVMDPATANISFGSPEQGIMAVAMVQLARFYGLPVGTNIGLTDAKIPDAQAGIEKGISLVLGALSGADIFGHMGISGADQGARFSQLVIDNELAGFVRRIRKSFQVTEATLAVGLIKSVGIGGTFLDTEHTLKNFRKEYWFPTLFDRQNWDGWVSSGKKTLQEVGFEQVKDCLRKHDSVPLDDDLCREIDKLVDRAEKELIPSSSRK